MPSETRLSNFIELYNAALYTIKPLSIKDLSALSPTEWRLRVVLAPFVHYNLNPNEAIGDALPTHHKVDKHDSTN